MGKIKLLIFLVTLQCLVSAQNRKYCQDVCSKCPPGKPRVDCFFRCENGYPASCDPHPPDGPDHTDPIPVIPDITPVPKEEAKILQIDPDLIKEAWEAGRPNNK